MQHHPSSERRALVPRRILDRRRPSRFGHGIVGQDQDKKKHREEPPAASASERYPGRPGVRVIVGGKVTAAGAAGTAGAVPLREWRSPRSSRITPPPDKNPRIMHRSSYRRPSENARQVGAEGVNTEKCAYSRRRPPERLGVSRSGNGQKGAEAADGEGQRPPPGGKASIYSPSSSSSPIAAAAAAAAASLRYLEGRESESDSPAGDTNSPTLENPRRGTTTTTSLRRDDAFAGVLRHGLSEGTLLSSSSSPLEKALPLGDPSSASHHVLLGHRPTLQEAEKERGFTCRRSVQREGRPRDRESVLSLIHI